MDDCPGSFSPWCLSHPGGMRCDLYVAICLAQNMDLANPVFWRRVSGSLSPSVDLAYPYFGAHRRRRGGEVTCLTMSYTIVADITEEAERSVSTCFGCSGANPARSVIFSLMDGGFTIGAMASKPLTYLPMKRSPWLSIYTGLAVLAFA